MEFALAGIKHQWPATEGFAEVIFGARIHPVIAELVWTVRVCRDAAGGIITGPDTEAEAALGRLAKIAVAHGDSGFFDQVSHCLKRFPAGSAWNYPDRALIMFAWRYSWKDGQPPSAAAVAETANGLTSKRLTVSRVTNELDRMSLRRATSKN